MNHDPHPRDPLTPEEQALARRLDQLGPHGEPSPALDARILASARAAQATPVRRVRRWPLALGLAASLVLAAGIAWRLRPLPGPMLEEGMTRTAAAPAEAIEGAGTAQETPKEKREVPSAPVAAGSATASRGRAPATDEARADTTAPAAAVTRSAPVPAPVPLPPPPEPAVVLDAPAPPAPAMAALPPPPPAPPASDAGALPPRAAAAGTPAPIARKAASPAAQAEEDAGFDAAAAADAASGDEPPEDVPPATADAPAVREAWLQRIRELLATGQTEAARASAKEFVRRHPDAPLPDDLRALAK